MHIVNCSILNVGTVWRNKWRRCSSILFIRIRFSKNDAVKSYHEIFVPKKKVVLVSSDKSRGQASLRPDHPGENHSQLATALFSVCLCPTVWSQ